MIQKTPENRLKYEEYTRKPLETGEGSVAISSLNQGEKCAKNIRKLKKNSQNQKIFRKPPENGLKSEEYARKPQKMGQKTSEYDPKNPPTIQKTPQNIPKHVKIYQLKCNRQDLSPKKSGKSLDIHEKSPKTRKK